MDASLLTIVLLAAVVSTAAHAGTVQDNLNRSTTVASAEPSSMDTNCRKWTSAPIQLIDHKISVDGGKLAAGAVANVLGWRPGGQTARPNSHVCNRSAIPDGPRAF